MENVSHKLGITTGIQEGEAALISVSSETFHTFADFSTSYAFSALHAGTYVSPVSGFSTYQHA